jgi:integrase/recombinase XerD
MTTLRQALADYLRIRRGLGFKLKADQRILENFVGFLEQAGSERVTSELALMWARLPVRAHPHHWRQRLGIVRGFARYVATLDPESEIPSEDLLRAHRPRVAPYIYSPAEITALMEAAGTLTPPLRAANYRTMIGLMATTGLRLGEAVALDRQDVDLADGALRVPVCGLQAHRWLRDWPRARRRCCARVPSAVASLHTRWPTTAA